jgi:signal transduction histidine kinase
MLFEVSPGQTKPCNRVLLSRVVHDLNGALAIVMGYSDMMVNELHPPESQQELMREVLEASERAALLTKRLSSVIRELGLHPPEPEF